MTYIGIVRFCCSVLAGLIVGSAASAQTGPTYTFTVPVNVSEVHPDVPGMRVYCYLRNSAGYAVASGYADIPLDSNRAYSGTVTIQITVDDTSLLPLIEDRFCNIQHQGNYNTWMSSHQGPEWCDRVFSRQWRCIL